MKRWMVLFVCALVLGVFSLMLRFSSFDTWGMVVGYMALIIFIWSLIQLSLVARFNRSITPSQSRGQRQKRRPVFRSKTQALHAAIFGSSAADAEEVEE